MTKQSESDNKRRQNNAAVYRTFTGAGDEADAAVAREVIVAICGVNDRVETTGGIDAVIGMAKREGKREVWLDLMKIIKVGQREKDEAVWDTVADSEGAKDAWSGEARSDGTGG